MQVAINSSNKLYRVSSLKIWMTSLMKMKKSVIMLIE